MKLKAAGRGTGVAKHARVAKKAKSQATQKRAGVRKPAPAPKPRRNPGVAKPAATQARAAKESRRRQAPQHAGAGSAATQPPQHAEYTGIPIASLRAEERYAGLTEADLLRAPPAQYMSAEQVAFFRERLRAMQRELLQKAGLTSEHLRQHDIESDPTDQATIEEEYALELRARDRERKLLKKIEQALRRIEDGSYGYCEETGDAIGIARLLARPTATLSIEAQSRRELKQKLYGD